jgi:hypothetical protein
VIFVKQYTAFYKDLSVSKLKGIIIFQEVSLKILKGLEAAVEVVKGILKQYDSDSYRYMLQLLLQAAIVLYQQVENVMGLSSPEGSFNEHGSYFLKSNN